MSSIQPADESHLPFDKALAALRDDVDDGYGARITPVANLLRVGQDLFPNADRGALKEGLYVEHSIWRYQLAPDKVRAQINTAVTEYDSQRQTDTSTSLTTAQVKTIIKVAAHRRLTNREPY